VRRKRSFEDLEGELAETIVARNATKHVRKRSRDSPDYEMKEKSGLKIPVEEAPEPESTAEPVESTVADEELNTKHTPIERPKTPVADQKLSPDKSIEPHPSPQKKRSRDQFDQDHQQECQLEVNSGAGMRPSAEAEEDTTPSLLLPKPEEEPELKRSRDNPPPPLVEETSKMAAKVCAVLILEFAVPARY